MCGIIGVLNSPHPMDLIKKGMVSLKERGKDGTGYWNEGSSAIAHALHAVVGRVPQPFKEENIFAVNCEIYNWKGLNKEMGIKTKNDAETLYRLLNARGVSDKSLDPLDGVYAFCFLKEGILYLARDIIGEKPLWYSHHDQFCFASEKKALLAMGCPNPIELNPRKIAVYDVREDQLSLIERRFFSIPKPLTGEEERIAEEVGRIITSAVRKRIPQTKFGILFSGGIDSTVIAKVLKDLGASFTCYTCIVEDPAKRVPEDLVYAEKVASVLGLDHKVIRIRPSDIPKMLSEIVPMIEDSNVVKVEVALTFYAACKQAGKDGCRVLMTGLGSEEIFAGYNRHKESTEINKECLSGLRMLYERDLYRDDVITMHQGIEARLPFLDKELISYALSIPGSLKIRDGVEKYILRMAARRMGIPELFASRRKLAAQYGSNVGKAVSGLMKQGGFRLKSDFFRSFYPGHALRLGALVSSGKDSIYAMHVMLRQNYHIACMITVASENPDSFMFHTPTVELVRLQSIAIGVPVQIGSTRGVKEHELEDLEILLAEAKERYQLEGIVTGALFSVYQRDRIERICDRLSLKVFSPLWHINQETEMRAILKEGFSIMMTRIAAEGLDRTWLGREITDSDIDRLAELNRKIGLNVAGEGGEFETLVLDCPLFNQKITVLDSVIEDDDERTATLVIRKALLSDKEVPKPL